MLRKIFFTVSSKLFVSIINFVIIFVTARYLGATGRGIISLLVLGITINILVSSVFGGASLSYLAPRLEIFRLVTPAYLWGFFSSVIVSIVLTFTKLIPEGYGVHLFFLSLIQSFYSIHLNLLLGKAKIKEQNLVNALQVAILLSVLLWIIFISGNKTIGSYLIALYSSLICSLFLSLYFLKDEIKIIPPGEWLGLWKTIFKNGYVIQIASLAQLLNYRLSFYLLDHFVASGIEGKRLVGIYSTAIAIAEATWLIGRSMGLVQYTNVLRDGDTAESRNLTVRFGKISLMITTCIFIPLVIFPAWTYQLLFGNEFYQIPAILIVLLPGILSFSMSLMYSNYFAGLGLNRVNLIGSLIGLVVTLLSGFILVPAWGMKGAAVTASLSFLLTSAYLWMVFVRRTKINLKAMLPERGDINYLKNILRQNISGN